MKFCRRKQQQFCARKVGLVGPSDRSNMRPDQVFYDTEIQILIADLLQLGLLDGLEMVSRVPGRNIIQDPQGYTYSFMNEYKGSNSSRWRCSRRNKKTKCLAFLVVSDDYILRREHMHICSIDKAEKH